MVSRARGERARPLRHGSATRHPPGSSTLPTRRIAPFPPCDAKPPRLDAPRTTTQFDRHGGTPGTGSPRAKPRWNFSSKVQREEIENTREPGSPSPWGLTTEEKIQRLNQSFERWIPSYTSPTGLDREFPSPDGADGQTPPWEQAEEKKAEKRQRAAAKRSPSTGKVWTESTGWTEPTYPSTHDFLRKRNGHQAWEGSPGTGAFPLAFPSTLS